MTDDLARGRSFRRDRDGWRVRLGRLRRLRLHWHAPTRCLWLGLRDSWGLGIGVWKW